MKKYRNYLIAILFIIYLAMTLSSCGAFGFLFCGAQNEREMHKATQIDIKYKKPNKKPNCVKF